MKSMSFLEKVKNMFTEEVEDEDEVRVEKIKRDVTQVPIESPIVDEEYEDEEEIENDSIINNFSFKEEEKTKPVFFDDNDFEDLKLNEKPVIQPKVEVVPEKIETYKEPERELYSPKVKQVDLEEKKVFKPTPIISPIYGILDKNYHKEDIVSKKKETEYTSVTPSSIDTIRNKAYGTLEDELENTLFGANSILFKKDTSKKDEEITEVGEDVISDLTDDISKELDELLIKKEKYSEKEVKESVKKSDSLDGEDLLGFIDSTLYKGDEE